MKEEVNGNRVEDPGEGITGNQKPTQKPGWLLDKFKTAEEQAKAYSERDKQAAQAIEKIRKLEEEKETSLDQAVGTRDSEIEQLKKQLDELKRPPSTRRYNPVEVKKYADLVTAVANGEEGAAEQLLDYNRGLAIYDRQMEDRQKTEVANKRAITQQWGKVKDDYGVDEIRAMSSEISTVLEKYPELKNSASANPDAMTDIVRIASKMHEEKVRALKAEEELRDAEKEASQTGKPSGGGTIGEDENKMSLEELEKKYGWNPDGGPITPA